MNSITNNFPCQCGMSFDILPHEFHPSKENPLIHWYRLGGTEGSDTYYGFDYQSPGDYDIVNMLTGNRYRLVMLKSFKICIGYAPDNLKWLEEQCEYNNKY